MEAIVFPYDTKVVSHKQYDNHMTLYKGYVTKSNEIAKTLAANPERESAGATAGVYRGMKKGETYALNGVILHELYFQNLGSAEEPSGSPGRHSAPGTRTRSLLARDFGSVENWRADFAACAKTARGWSVLCYEQRSKRCRNILLDFHDQGNIALAYPLLVLDMYEHAYFMDYGVEKDKYIERFMAGIPWGVVEGRAEVVV